MIARIPERLTRGALAGARPLYPLAPDLPVVPPHAIFVGIDIRSASWPGLSRPSTSLLSFRFQGVDARDERGHDESRILRLGIIFNRNRQLDACLRAIELF
jgi:hypothetical protein